MKESHTLEKTRIRQKKEKKDKKSPKHMYIRPQNHQNGCLTFSCFSGSVFASLRSNFPIGGRKKRLFQQKEAKVDQRST